MLLRFLSDRLRTKLYTLECRLTDVLNQQGFSRVTTPTILSKAQLAQLNRHLRAIEKMLSVAPKTHEPSPGDTFVSLTLALMPLRNREVQS